MNLTLTRSQWRLVHEALQAAQTQLGKAGFDGRTNERLASVINKIEEVIDSGGTGERRSCGCDGED